MKLRKHAYFRRICAVILSLALMFSLSGCGKPSRETNEIETTVMGIDVARYQGTIDWQQLGASGIGFAMVRLGYRGISTGEIVEDQNARYNLQEGSRAGIPLGAYFFSTAITEEEAIEEATWAAELMAKYPITYPVVYDCEGFRDSDSRQHHMTNSERTTVALAFLKTIEDLGYEGMFYASKNEIDLFWDIEPIEESYKIWVAQYPADPYPQTPESSYEREHHMWQYTKDGKVLGITQSVDLNIAYFAYDGIEPAKDPVPAEEVGPNVEAMMTFTEVNEEVTAKSETNLRDIPSQDADSKVMAVLENGQIAQRIAISSSGWSKVLYAGNTYYAVSSYLTTELTGEPAPSAEDSDGDGIKTQFSEANKLVTAKEVVNLRSIPSATREDAKILFQLKNGAIAICTGESTNGWSRLQYNGETCYAVSSYLTPYVGSGTSGEDVGMEFDDIRDKVTPKKEVNLRLQPSTEKDNIIAKVSNGEVFHRIGINKNLGWSKVVYYGQTLYCSTGLLINAVE